MLNPFTYSLQILRVMQLNIIMCFIIISGQIKSLHELQVNELEETDRLKKKKIDTDLILLENVCNINSRINLASSYEVANVYKYKFFNYTLCVCQIMLSMSKNICSI